MKRVVVFDSYKPSEIKPSEVFDKYLELTFKEVKRLLIDKGKLIDIDCPACSHNKKRFAFKKFGLNYVECIYCGTLYISPRPSEENINNYFLKSKANDFLQKSLLKETVNARVEHLVKPEVVWIANRTGESFTKPEIFVDIKSRRIELLDEINKLHLFKEKIIVDPEISVSKTLAKMGDFKVIDKSIWDVDTSSFNANVVTGLYVLDRLHDPQRMLKIINTMLTERGLLFLVSSTISGLDLQVLWENSKTIFPPENMNVLSTEGVEILLEKNGFEIIELSTPGHLDLEYIKNAMEEDKNIKLPRFISYLIKNRGEDAHTSFQNFLQEFRLSSHMRVVARKK